MGGIISYLTSKGVQVDYLTVTDGSLGDIGIIEGDLKEIRKNEAINAGKLLGVKEFFFLEHLDGELNDVPSLAREIATIIRQNNYDSIAAPDPFNSYEAHYDHIVTGRAAAQAAISVNLKEYPRGTTTKPVNLSSVLFYFTQRPNSLIDITNHFEKKMAATALHKSQITPELLNLYTSYFAYRGMQLSGSDKLFEGVKDTAKVQTRSWGQGDGNDSNVDKILELFEEVLKQYPEESKDVAFVIDKYIEIIDQSDELTKDEKMVLKPAFAAVLYSTKFWDDNI